MRLSGLQLKVWELEEQVGMLAELHAGEVARLRQEVARLEEEGEGGGEWGGGERGRGRGRGREGNRKGDGAG